MLRIVSPFLPIILPHARCKVKVNFLLMLTRAVWHRSFVVWSQMGLLHQQCNRLRATRRSVSYWDGSDRHSAVQSHHRNMHCWQNEQADGLTSCIHKILRLQQMLEILSLCMHIPGTSIKSLHSYTVVHFQKYSSLWAPVSCARFPRDSWWGIIMPSTNFFQWALRDLIPSNNELQC
jgi:hypothetical protein